MSKYEATIHSLSGDELLSFLDEANNYIDTTIDKLYTTDELMETGYFESKDELYCYYIEVANNIFAAPEYLYEKIPYLMKQLDDMEYFKNPYRFY